VPISASDEQELGGVCFHLSLYHVTLLFYHLVLLRLRLHEMVFMRAEQANVVKAGAFADSDFSTFVLLALVFYFY
jgi:hypothetical protein